MARKSRKQPIYSTESTARVEIETDFIRESTLATAAYVRLSRENGGHETDDTLQTQIKLVHSYILEQPELSLIDTYVDNGVSGTKFDRPEFNRLMQDVKTGRVQCIVVKDLSRFGRDYLEAGYYLDQIFPLLNGEQGEHHDTDQEHDQRHVRKGLFAQDSRNDQSTAGTGGRSQRYSTVWVSV